LILNSLIAVTLSILSPIYLRDITNALEKYQNNHTDPTDADKMYHTVLQTSLMIIVFYVAKLVLSDLPYNLIKTYFDQNSGDKFRKVLFKKIGKLPLSYFDNSSIGHNMTVMVHDTGNVSGNFIGSICQVFTGFVYLIGLMIAMFITNWAMALLCIIAVPIFGTFLPMIIKKSKVLYDQR
jgi:ABC-type multidrug transport system fused ATPase/permease subunit